MKEPTDHIIICSGCGIPLEECPDSWERWQIQERRLPCPHGDPSCPQHLVLCRYWCVRCTQEGKAETMLKEENDCPHGAGGRDCSDTCRCFCHHMRRVT